jgi:hypothetical protein
LTQSFGSEKKWYAAAPGGLFGACYLQKLL